MNYLKSLILRLFPLSFLFFLFAVPIFPASLPVDFFGARAFGNGGTFYYEMKEGDFNGDGKTDVLMAEIEGNVSDFMLDDFASFYYRNK